jgi:hypothetical protein
MSTYALNEWGLTGQDTLIAVSLINMGENFLTELQEIKKGQEALFYCIYNILGGYTFH